MRVVVTGARGLLGAAIVREFSDTDLHAFDHAQFDIASESTVADLLATARPDVVINCAAYNDVDRAEHEADAALRTNALGVLSLARAADDTGAIFVHYSTDFVFDGATDRPYVETDAPNPLGVYGASKLVGEWFSRECRRAYVLRVESLFGEPGAVGAKRGSLGTIVDRILAGTDVPVFVDRTVSPTYTADVARATRQLIDGKVVPGLYHCVNSGAATWLDVAQEAARLIGRPLKARPLTLATAKLAALRPQYCALAPARLAAAGIVMPSWQDALARYLSSTAL